MENTAIWSNDKSRIWFSRVVRIWLGEKSCLENNKRWFGFGFPSFLQEFHHFLKNDGKMMGKWWKHRWFWIPKAFFSFACGQNKFNILLIQPRAQNSTDPKFWFRPLFLRYLACSFEQIQKMMENDGNDGKWWKIMEMMENDGNVCEPKTYLR